MWRYVRDEIYNGFSIQKQKKFLWFTWWADQYLVNNEQTAIEFTNKLNNK
jgi:hypothetical protein